MCEHSITNRNSTRNATPPGAGASPPPRRPSRAVLAALAALAASLSIGPLGSAPAFAAQINLLQVSEHGGGYDIELDALVDAPADRVYAVLTDFAHLDRIDPDILSSEVAAAPSGAGTRVSTRLRMCIWVFCRRLLQVEDVTTTGRSVIEARIVPGLGDFLGGSATWRLTPEGARTHIRYRARREPAFWMPAPIARMAAGAPLRRQIERSVSAVEALAAGK